MNNFLWIGNRAVNLGCIAFFSIERDEVLVMLSGLGETDRRIAVNGKQAADLIAWLNANVQTIPGATPTGGVKIICPETPVNPDSSVIVDLDIPKS